MRQSAENPQGPAPAGEREVEVIEVVAEPMPDESKSGDPKEKARRFRRRLGPVLAGMVIDVVDLTTFVPIVGFSLGTLSGLWLSGPLGYRPHQRLFVALACGVYCMFPPTGFLPLATLLGIWANLREPD